jgi:regulator of G-protein signaling 3/regulator of G-protein signaling
LSTRPQPEEAQKWSESFAALMASKCKSSLKSTQMSKGHEKK